VARWARALDSLGVRSIDNVVVDASAYDAVPYGPGWAWDDEGYGFAAPISAAAIYDNAVTVTVTPGRAPGRSVLIDLSPATAYVTLKVTAVTSRPDSASTLDVHRDRGDAVIQVSGNIAAGAEPFTESISIDEPAVYFATLVAEELQRRGITVRGSAIDAAERAQPIDYRRMRPTAISYSPPLREILTVINKQSHNLAAEMVLKKLGREFAGSGSTAAGVEVVRGVLVSAGLDIERMRIHDGSGLARQSMVSPHDIVQLLRWIRSSPLGTEFLATLSVAGRDGTLARRLQGTLGEGNVLAKTGYFSGVRAVSGYVRSRDGEWLAFSIVANNYTVPTSIVNNAQDLILMRLASFTRRS
jgi:PBP4 family serine-type D-alanyl-D-alanine carboxypeptidase